MKEHGLKDLSDEQISQMLAYLSDELGRNAKVIEGETAKVINAEPIMTEENKG
jgi:hypothetical protein